MYQRMKGESWIALDYELLNTTSHWNPSVDNEAVGFRVTQTNWCGVRKRNGSINTSGQTVEHQGCKCSKPWVGHVRESPPRSSGLD